MEITRSYRGHVANGQIALDEPITLPEGAVVSVRLLKAGAAPVACRLTRREILQMPLDKRRQLLASQSERLTDLYASDPDRTEWQGGDLLE